MKRKMKKKREGVAAKPRRQGDGEGGGRKEKRNAGSSPATPAALQAAPARETTFRVWSASWGGGSRTEEMNGVGKETGRRLEGKITNRKMEEEWKPGGGWR